MAQFFRMKPGVVMAEQWRVGLDLEGVLFDPNDVTGKRAFLLTNDGLVRMDEGDYVITDTVQRHFLCKRETFAQLYEAVTPDIPMEREMKGKPLAQLMGTIKTWWMGDAPKGVA